MDFRSHHEAMDAMALWREDDDSSHDEESLTIHDQLCEFCFHAWAAIVEHKTATRERQAAAAERKAAVAERQQVQLELERLRQQVKEVEKRLEEAKREQLEMSRTQPKADDLLAELFDARERKEQEKHVAESLQEELDEICANLEAAREERIARENATEQQFLMSMRQQPSSLRPQGPQQQQPSSVPPPSRESEQRRSPSRPQWPQQPPAAPLEDERTRQSPTRVARPPMPMPLPDDDDEPIPISPGSCSSRAAPQVGDQQRRGQVTPPPPMGDRQRPQDRDAGRDRVKGVDMRHVAEQDHQARLQAHPFHRAGAELNSGYAPRGVFGNYQSDFAQSPQSSSLPSRSPQSTRSPGTSTFQPLPRSPAEEGSLSNYSGSDLGKVSSPLGDRRRSPFHEAASRIPRCSQGFPSCF